MNLFTPEGKEFSERSNIVPIYDFIVELKDRIRTARQHADLDQSELARRCGVNPSAINHQESGKARSLSGELLMNISKETKTRPEWILWGEGEMTNTESAKPVEQPYDVVLTHLAGLPDSLERSLRSEIEAKYYKELYKKEELHPPIKGVRRKPGPTPKGGHLESPTLSAQNYRQKKAG